MPRITITYQGKLFHSRKIYVKLAKNNLILSHNLDEQNSFELPAGKHIIQIKFRTNIYLLPSSRFIIEVKENENSYYNLEESPLGYYLEKNMTLYLKSMILYALFPALGIFPFNKGILTNLVVFIPILLYYQIRLLKLIPYSQRVVNGYLELRYA